MKQIKSYENYLITLDGKLFSLKSMRFLSLHNKTKAGYPRAELFNEDGSKWHLIHRLVAEAYLPNQKNKPQVNHINGVKSNNILFNLEWATPSENQKHCCDTGLRVVNQKMLKALSNGGKKNGAANGKKAREKTSKLILDTQNGIYYTGINEAAFVIGCKPTTLKAKLNGQNKNLTTFKYV
jgi:hypothetical protein